jgi:hypothetical protein
MDPRQFNPCASSTVTRLPVEKRITTIDPLRTVALLLSYGTGLLIYGTVLPWQSDAGDVRAEPPPKSWQEHRRVVEEQAQEWQALRAQFPDTFLAIAGDWNTDLLAGSGLTRRSYGPMAEAKRLVESLEQLGLQIPTRNVPDLGGGLGSLITSPYHKETSPSRPFPPSSVMRKR